jgi:hypothetical protein
VNKLKSLWGSLFAPKSKAVAIILFTSIFPFSLFNNCARLESQHIELSSDINSSSMEADSELRKQGTALYAQHCALCHQNFDTSTVKNKTANEITAALSNISVMSALRLSKSEIDLIALALSPIEQRASGPGVSSGGITLVASASQITTTSDLLLQADLDSSFRGVTVNFFCKKASL